VPTPNIFPRIFANGLYMFPLASFGCLWNTFGFPWVLTPLGDLGLPLGVLWFRLECTWAPFGCPLGSLAPSWDIWSRVEIHRTTHDYRRGRCNLKTKPTIIEGRGHIPCKQIDIKYYQMCSIHETVHQNHFVGVCMRILQIPRVPPAGPAEVVASSVVRSPTSTRAGGQDDVSFTKSLQPFHVMCFACSLCSMKILLVCVVTLAV